MSRRSRPPLLQPARNTAHEPAGILPTTRPHSSRTGWVFDDGRDDINGLNDPCCVGNGVVDLLRFRSCWRIG